MLNTIVAESLDFIATQARRRRSRAGKDLNTAIQDLLPGIIKESKKVLFNGDNYTEEWHTEAEKRGLPNLQEHRRTPCRSSSARTRSSCSRKYKVYSERELQSRFNILCESYVKTVDDRGQADAR